MTSLEQYRQEKDRFFRLSGQSPLTPEQRKSFQGLVYFPENEQLRMEISLERAPKAEPVQMQTSTGDVQDYFKAGHVRFPVNDEEAVLQVYVSAQGGDYFIPFVDATAPDETYGAGRYLEPEDLGDGKLLLDFNVAYNPYCAYNEMWSCPLPPRENRLKMRIEAGEKNFHK